MLGVQKNVLNRTVLNDFTAIHDRNRIGDVPGQTEVVGDDKRGQPDVLLQSQEKRQDLAAHRSVEGGHRFVGNEHIGLECQRAGNNNALALPAGKLLRDGLEEVLPGGQLRSFQAFAHPRPFVTGELLHAQAFGDGLIDRARRVQRSRRVLQNHLHVAPESAQTALGARQGFALEQKL